MTQKQITDTYVGQTEQFYGLKIFTMAVQNTKLF